MSDSWLSKKVPGKWLPETHDTEVGDGRPFRPDLPWFRNLRWTKVHAMQLGLAFALVVYWGQALGMDGAVFGLAVSVFKFAMGHRQKKDCDSSCNHELGFHDVKEKPWYFLSAALATYVLLGAVFSFPVDVRFSGWTLFL